MTDKKSYDDTWYNRNLQLDQTDVIHRLGDGKKIHLIVFYFQFNKILIFVIVHGLFKVPSLTNIKTE